MNAQELRYEIRGVDGPMLGNVQSHVDAFQVTGNVRVSSARYERAVAAAEDRARAGLRPYGYYRPVITSEPGPKGLVVMRIDVGPPIEVSRVDIQLVGDGAELEGLRDWQRAWPLPVGAVLDQAAWEDHKVQAIEIAHAQGYLQAEFAVHSIEIDLDENKADLALVFDTGRRSAMGKISYNQEILRPLVLDNVPRFDEGEPYTAYLMERFRMDLWMTGYFTDVEVLERHRTDVDPPVVDLQVNLETKTRNTYQGALGYGSDTGIRLQAKWSRVPVSSRGDRLDTAIGWQNRGEELLLRSNYRFPRRSAKRQYWVSEVLLKTEQHDFTLKLTPEDEEAIRVAEGRINDFKLRVGRLRVRNLQASGDQAFETLFAQHLTEDNQLDLLPDAPPDSFVLPADPEFQRRVTDGSKTLSFGIDWDRSSIRGKGFEMVGRRDRAWAFISNEAWGSEIDYVQVYLSTRRNYVVGDRWKFLIRAEAGYSDAKIDRFTATIDGRPVTLGITRLPELYRFRAGGSQSVRGYGFESLSDNDLGSNNIITASAEVEMKFLDNWSAAAFFDVGNAFNEWSKPDLKKGTGIGIRWYSIIGAIRIDYARALDFKGRPWKWHLTIGTPLL